MGRLKDTITLDIFEEYLERHAEAVPQDDNPLELSSDKPFARQMSELIGSALKESELSRKEIAMEMSEFLGRTISVDVIETWAAPSRRESPSIDRFMALILITKQPKLLNFLCSLVDFIAVPSRYRAVIEEHHALVQSRKWQKKANFYKSKLETL